MDTHPLFPATKAQSRMWFLNYIQPYSSAYTSAFGLLFEKPASVERLITAINVIYRAIDLMADWLVKLANERSTERAFHLVNEHSVSYSTLAGQLVSCGFQVESLNFPEFKAAVRRATVSKSEEFVGTILRQLERTPGPNVPLDSQWSISLYKRLDFPQFKPTMKWLELFIQHARAKGFLA